VVRGTHDLLPIVYDLPVPSAQVKSRYCSPACTRRAAPRGRPLASRDHTERMLGYFGAELIAEDRGQGARAVTICGDAGLHGASIACRAIKLCRLHDRRPLSRSARTSWSRTLLNPTRSRLIETLREMDAHIELLDRRLEAARPSAISASSRERAKGVHIPAERAPSMIDEYPVLACSPPSPRARRGCKVLPS
jgi:3-phosphoshikimate 1-carboxyvinyltransferase